MLQAEQDGRRITSEDFENCVNERFAELRGAEESFGSEHSRHQDVLARNTSCKQLRLGTVIADELSRSPSGVSAGPQNRQEKESKETHRLERRSNAR